MTSKQLLTFLICIILTGCMVEPSFTEPQPTGKSNLENFKKKFRGEYICLNDSSRLTISETKIIQEWKVEFRISKTEVDTSDGLRYADGRLYSTNFPGPMNASISGDSILGVYTHSSTLFEISDSSRLRYFKGRHFLNTKRSENDWSVKLLELTAGRDLGLHRIAGVDQIEGLAELTEVATTTNEEGEVVEYSITPSRKEFKAIVNSSLFNEGSNFKKLKTDS